MHKRNILAVFERTPERKSLVSELLSEGYGVSTVGSPSEAVEMIRNGHFDMVMADVSSPKVDSLNFLSYFTDKNPVGKTIILSRRPDFNTAMQSLRLSAYDYLFEPIAREILIDTIGQAFRDSDKALARLRAHVTEENIRLKEELERANLETIVALANALEARDEYTRGHSYRVSELSVRVGERMGLSREDIRKLRYGGILHDIGKIGVDKKILNKKTPLSKVDFENIYQHTLVGVKIVSSVESLKGVLPLIHYHHEPYQHLSMLVDENSKTYLLISIIKAVDAFDAMVSDRPYRKALPVEMAVTELMHYSGTDFHPEVVKAISKIVRGELVRTLRNTDAFDFLDGNGFSLGYR